MLEYVFTHVCDSVHTGRRVVSQYALQVSGGGGGIPACLTGLQAHTWGEVEGSGLGGSPGPHPGGVSQHALRQTPPSPMQMATAAGGTHPTGMHSCFREEFSMQEIQRKQSIG